MIDNYETQNEKFWNGILNNEKIITDEEADDLQEMVKKLRKERGLRKYCILSF